METAGQGYPLKVALIYGAAPSGHYAAARAVAEFLPPRIIEPVFINLSEVYPDFGPFVARTYLQLLGKTPALWEYVYDNDFVALAATAFREAILPFSSQKLADLLLKKNIRAAVSTQAFSSLLITKNRRLAKMPLFSVLTDFCAHAYWPPKGVKAYFAPERGAATQLKEKGAPADRIFQTGIPVRKEFTGPQPEKAAARKALGLAPHQFTVLITGGSRGLGDLLQAALALKPLLGRLQVVVLCGNNRRLCRQAEKASGSRRSMRFVEFTDNPADYYRAADLVVGKPGGVTLAETMALARPFIIYSPLPGQEERNTAFLYRHRLAETAGSPEELEPLVRRYLHSPATLAHASRALAEHARPHAARDIAAKIIETLTGNGG
ncbi:MAG: glycosyltransferase [Elusimicrobiales bacterium]|nr:glycosyltransferase [Elusimicrobiales bacterium]